MPPIPSRLKTRNATLTSRPARRRPDGPAQAGQPDRQGRRGATTAASPRRGRRRRPAARGACTASFGWRSSLRAALIGRTRSAPTASLANTEPDSGRPSARQDAAADAVLDDHREGGPDATVLGVRDSEIRRPRVRHGAAIFTPPDTARATSSARAGIWRDPQLQRAGGVVDEGELVPSVARRRNHRGAAGPAEWPRATAACPDHADEHEVVGPAGACVAQSAQVGAERPARPSRSSTRSASAADTSAPVA